MDRVFIDEVVRDLATVGDFIRWAMSRFSDAELYYGHGTDNPWDEAVALVLHSLHLPPDMDNRVFESRLTTSEKQNIAELVVRRVHERLPLPYLTNTAYYAGTSFYVDERVLIPRSPIFELIEQEFQPMLGEKKVTRALDLCTGSACLAILMANAFPDAEVDAVDLSEDALAVADINIQHHGLSHRVIPMQSDLFNAIQQEKYDLIVSNPPYVDEEDMSDLPDEYHHEPEMALAAGFDGLDLVKRMLFEAPDMLTDNGLLVVEVGNSLVHMQEQFPDVPFVWMEFERGGDGVFAIHREDLLAHRDKFGSA